MSKARRIILAFAVLNAILFGWFSSFIAEDAYIVYRYSENLSDGSGLVFNPGEYVSALTSPLHSLIVSVLYWFSGESVWSNRLVAWILHFAATAYSYQILRQYRTLLLYGFMVWLSPYIIFWTAGGLETIYLSSFLTVAFTAACHCREEFSHRDQLIFSICLGLAFLTRFDSCLVTLPLWFHVANCQWNHSEDSKLRSMLYLLLPGLLIALAWLVVSYNYYHDIFPTSVYHKPARWDHQRTNVLYMIQFGLLTGILPLLGWTLISHVKHDGSRLR